MTTKPGAKKYRDDHIAPDEFWYPNYQVKIWIDQLFEKNKAFQDLKVDFDRLKGAVEKTKKINRIALKEKFKNDSGLALLPFNHLIITLDECDEALSQVKDRDL